MKKLLTVLTIAGFMSACNNSGSKTETTATDSVKKMQDAKMSAPSTNTPAKMEEGMVTMKDGKMMEMKNGNLVAMDNTMTCADGCKVMVSGEVNMPDGKKMMMTEGMIMTKDGYMMDKNGNALHEEDMK